MKIYKFEADWCHICKAVDKILEKNEYKDLITHVNIDTEDGRTLGDLFGVRQLPTFIICSDDKTTVYERFYSCSSDEFTDFVKQHIGKA